MPDRIIISDTSSLIALSNIGELKIVRQIYKEVVITPEIATEYGMEIPDWIKIKQVNDSQKLRLLDLGLDLGESSAITLALEYDSSLLIIDEKKGRRIAKELGIKITGILGVIIKAKETRIIKKVKPLIEKLEKADFRISPKLKNHILAKAEE